MKIKVLAIGKIKEPYLKEGINEYLKRIKPYANIEIVEVNDEPVNDNPKEADITKVKNIEGERVLKLLKDNDYVISLDLNKKQYTSPEFAKYLEDRFIRGGSSITFIIGGSYGLSDALKARANDSLSLSNMTFLHQMSRLILLEQIYRAFKINRNETYHK
ncbi:MAG: 23S rRNA (pseudouridine(1915)-N(3))-methyltransferase RlmH [Bacilli bacterium]|nr:23S rRNA (pseudouridine(1915)-N(3))-methyltransferase RlmH [Bacilli bacterium]